MLSATSPDASPNLALDDLKPFKQFAMECERRKLATEQQHRWWLRFRTENGLFDSGAVFEMHPTGARNGRPMLFVVVPLHWCNESGHLS